MNNIMKPHDYGHPVFQAQEERKRADINRELK